ncbi:MAG: hypothetical protein RBS96_06995 [Dehalococcoidales bacterium]|nr:hypothetical protein [Dehalococcoidales bacterium]
MADRQDNSRQTWSFIPMNKYSSPPAVRTEAAARSIGRLIDLVRSKTREPEALIAGADLKPVGQKLLKKLLPQIPVDQLAMGLAESLGEWEKAGPTGFNGLFVVGAPFCLTAEIVEVWAKSNGCQVIAPPGAGDIIKGDEGVLSALHEAGKPVVFTRFEKWYLRQTEGLDLIRKLINRLQSLRKSYVIQCDSWAWAYLSVALEINQLYPEPIVLEPLDYNKLEIWLGSPSVSKGVRDWVFRQSNNGNYVINPSVSGVQKADENIVTTDFLKHLAAYSRGNPGVARAIWALNLQALPDEDADESMVKEAHAQEGRVIWVKPWAQDNCPYMAKREKISLMVLHAILLHGGLSVDELNYLLPSPAHQIQIALHQLFLAGLVEEDAGEYFVTPAGYPSVRQTLYGEGFLVDGI